MSKRLIGVFFLVSLLFVMGFVIADNETNDSNETPVPTLYDVGVYSPGEVSPQLVGGCGTVTPGLNDECCINQGYEAWDSELNECKVSTVGGCATVLPENRNRCCANLGYSSWDEEEVQCRSKRKIDDGGLTVSQPKQSTERERIQVQQVIQTKNRLELKIQQANETCPNNCTCDGSTMKCTTQDGNREMIIRAGNSGNTIVQVKNSEMSTMVKLYKSEDGQIYGIFKGEQTKKIVLPDEASETAKQRLQEKIKEEQRNRKRINLTDENITLTEEGIYEHRAKKRARLFWIISVKEKVHTQIDAETGSIIKTRHSWWGFLARDLREDISEE